MWSDCLLDLGSNFLIGDMGFVRDVYYIAVGPDFLPISIFLTVQEQQKNIIV